tara:strand:+ start:4094 stop:5314 length:1221 start_codon:yes stop_codon:yes gene_type:complete
MSNTLNSDITIIGGGIAGLWICNTLKKLGFNTILIEKNSLCSFQTINSQGIIHGGIKYSLVGKISDTTSNIAQMTQDWDLCFSNNIKNQKNLLNLSNTKINSEHHDLCFPKSGLFKVSSFITSKILSSKCQIIKKNHAEYQSSLNTLGFNGIVYRITEKVLDIKSLIQNLYHNISDNIVKLEDYKINYLNNKIENISFNFNNQNYIIKSKLYIFTSGQDNQEIINIANNLPKQQLRPLQMIFAKPDIDINLFAHFINKESKTNKPFVTITTHKNINNKNILYFGGTVAESEYINIPKDQHIYNLQNKLKKIFPKIKFNNWQWDTAKINRAEAHQSFNKMPNKSFVVQKNNVILGWPTKLTFAPSFADKILDIITNSNITPSSSTCFDYKKYNLNTANIATPCWEMI